MPFVWGAFLLFIRRRIKPEVLLMMTPNSSRSAMAVNLRAGDVITSIDDILVNSTVDPLPKLLMAKANSQVILEVIRGQETPSRKTNLLFFNLLFFYLLYYYYLLYPSRISIENSLAYIDLTNS